MLLFLSYCPRPPYSMTPPTALCGLGTCDWWTRGGCVVIAGVPIHQRTWALYSASHLRQGPISPFTNCARGGKKIKKNSPFFWANSTFSKSSRVPCGDFGSRLIPNEKEASAFGRFFWEGSLRSLFIHLSRSGSFVGPKAWDRKTPKPLERRKPR